MELRNKMDKKIKIGTVSTATPLLNIELAQKNTSRMPKTREALKAEILPIRNLVTGNTCVSLCWDFSGPCYKTASVES